LEPIQGTHLHYLLLCQTISAAFHSADTTSGLKEGEIQQSVRLYRYGGNYPNDPVHVTHKN
jgi:hypothetical protein